MTAPRLRVKVVCTDLPGRRFCDPHAPGQVVTEPVYLGVQRGREVTDQVPADRRQVTFTVEFAVGKRPDGSPNFLGPFAQGTPDDRFFYLSWGRRGPTGEFAMFRRLKIRLGHLGWREVRRSIGSEEPITVRLRLTDAQGGPLCGTPPASHVRWELPGPDPR